MQITVCNYKMLPIHCSGICPWFCEYVHLSLWTLNMWSNGLDFDCVQITVTKGVKNLNFTQEFGYSQLHLNQQTIQKPDTLVWMSSHCLETGPKTQIRCKRDPSVLTKMIKALKYQTLNNLDFEWILILCILIPTIGEWSVL